MIKPVEDTGDTAILLVALMTAAILVVGVDKLMDVELETLPATIAMLEDDTVCVNALLLTCTADVAIGRTTTLVEGTWDTVLVALLTAAILVVGVDTMIGVELEPLIATAAILEDDKPWLGGLLLTEAAEVAIGKTIKLVDEL